jgi:glycosyltransferase involved in cell wall biosynthesis
MSTARSERVRIGVVVSARNNPDELGLLLGSLRASTYRPLRLCVCDDASSKSLEEVLGHIDIEYAYRRNNVRRGVTTTRRRAFELSVSELILSLDSDVRLYPDTIERLVGTMEETGADVVVAIYSPVALDGGWFSTYYARFVHHSFLSSDRPFEYNVFNAWCALARREVLADVTDFEDVKPGVEIENELMGRRIVSRGYRLVMDPRIAVDHHWGGYRKLWFIYTRRVYWWVKTFFATGGHFEAATTTSSYAFANLAFPGACLAALLGIWFKPALGVALTLLLVFFLGYGSFFGFLRREYGWRYAIAGAMASAYFTFPVAVSATYSVAEELVRLALRRRLTVDPAIYDGNRRRS